MIYEQRQHSAWLAGEALRDLQERYRVISVPETEPLAADVLRIGSRICMSAEHRRTAELVSELGYSVRTVELSEFAKAEGGVTCLSIVF